MTTELTLLALSIVLGLVHNQAVGVLTTSQHGLAYGMSPRDQQRPLTGVPARVQRAFANFMQTFPFFAAAVLIAQSAGRHSGWTVTGAWLYLLGRLVYVPLYASGIPVIRTLVWGVATLGIVLVLIGLAA